LTFTTLYPNAVHPLHGLFVKNRVARMARSCSLTVVAPVNVGADPRVAWRVPKSEHANGLTVHHPRFGVMPGLLKHWDGELLFRQTIGQIRKRVALEAFDLVDAHYAYPDGVAGHRLAQEMGKPLVLSIRGSDINVLTRFPRRRRLIQDTMRQADAVVAVSGALAREAEALGVERAKIHVIPNGVDTALFFPRPKSDTRQRIGWPLDAYTVLSVGRLESVKRFDSLIQAVRMVRDRIGGRVRCIIAGDGTLRPTLERAIRRADLHGDVLLPGWVPPAMLALWYSAADLFCLLSQSEGCPNVVLESLACGTPVVAAHVGGIPEIVRDSETGFLVSSRRAEDVAACVERASRTRWDPAALAGSPAVRPWDEVADAQLKVFRLVAHRS
jgi:glycosyltransferase involved in cell wall biosynthesis